MSRLHIQNLINLALELHGQSLFVSNDPGVIVRSIPWTQHFDGGSIQHTS